MEDYYKILDIDRNATEAEIKKAYRKMALRYHPDRNPGDRQSETTFKKINEAYACLSNPDKRSHYDRYGTAEGVGDFGFGDFASNFGDIFGDIFGDFFGTFSGRGGARPSRGTDLRYDLELTLSEAVQGAEKSIDIPRWENCAACGGNGSRDGRSIASCSSCRGTGQTRVTQGFFTIARTCGKCRGTGQTITQPCTACNGKGKTRREKSVSLKIPPGVDTDIKLRVSGEGEAGNLGGPPGDLYVVINVLPHPFFKRKGNDIHCEVPISFTQAVLGGEMEVPTIQGEDEHVRIPPGTPSGRVFHLKGRGAPRLGRYGKGDQFVTVFVDVPKKLNTRQKQLLKEFAELSGEEPHKGFVDKIKEMFKEQAK